MSTFPPVSNPARSDAAYVVGFVTSQDGTHIGYRQYGAGPAVVLVQGAIGTTQSYHELASCLAGDFTVYVPERRGRPLSPGAYRPDHTIDRELEDLAAVFERSGAQLLFGLSSGAVIALEAARVWGSVRQLVLYEAPLYVPPQQLRRDLVARLQREVAASSSAGAMLTALFAAGTAPAGLRFLPRSLLEAALALFLRWDARRKTRQYPPLRELVPTVRFDFQVVGSRQNRFDTFRSVTSDVLLLGGSRSPAFLRRAAVALGQVLPQSQRLELPGLGHSGPWNADLGGQPQLVATAMRTFLRA